MLALWESLKENASCGNKVTRTDVVKYNVKKRSRNSDKENFDRHLIRKTFGDAIIRGYLSRPRFSELEITDPARNVTELIFQKASTNPTKPWRKILKVLRVKNSVEVLDRFEKYRDEVKQSSYKHQDKHPRTSVDGNELLRFYGTAMSCCSETYVQVSEICRDPSCGVCLMIRSNFDTEYNRKNGIRFSTNSEELTDKMIGFSKRKTERAVVVCRIIAGTVASKAADGVTEECDCCENETEFSNANSLIVRNPEAVLACFVIVFA